MNELTAILHNYHALGLVIGLSTFLIIGLFHPLVIKGEYYFGTRCRWWFLALGIVCTIASVAVSDILWSTLLGVIGFSSFWSIKEVLEQEERVRKGWFPRNPRRTYPWDTPTDTTDTPT
ncbi:MAG: DUF4491 family protein [Lachnospiraceae bacterium]|nr:DUF4491 family protein [Lachnospiraceae bacterium]